MNYQVELDMDGTITDFNKAARALGLEPQLVHRGVVPQSHFTRIVRGAGVDFFADMPWIKGGRKLWRFIQDKNIPVVILSAYMIDNESNSRKGKKIWIAENLGEDVKYRIVAREDKANYAKPNRILIDNDSRNIGAWNKAGGIGILHRDVDRTIERLKEVLADD